jgi:hypothetical protein
METRSLTKGIAFMHHDLREQKPRRPKKRSLSREDAIALLERRIAHHRQYLDGVQADGKLEAAAGRWTFSEACDLRAGVFELSIETMSAELDTLRRS